MSEEDDHYEAVKGSPGIFRSHKTGALVNFYKTQKEAISYFSQGVKLGQMLVDAEKVNDAIVFLRSYGAITCIQRVWIEEHGKEIQPPVESDISAFRASKIRRMSWCRGDDGSWKYLIDDAALAEKFGGIT